MIFKNVLILRCIFIFFLFLQGINTLAYAKATNQLKGVRSWPSPDNTRVVLDLTAKPNYDIHYLTKPDRVVIDIHGANSQVNLKKIANKGPLVSNFRQSASGKQGTYRLVIDLKQMSKAKVFILPPAKPYGHRLVLDLPHRVTTVKPDTTSSQNIAMTPLVGRDIVIAIDAGHGGDDPGALGKYTYEKKITLAIAKRLKRRIDSQKGMRAFLIRTGDYFVNLNQRSAIARKGKADFLVSIHADGFTSSRPHGASVWVLSNRRANTELGRWMEKHEAHSELLGGTGGLIEDSSSVPFLTEMFLDMSMGNAMDVGYKVGDLVVKELKKVTKLHKKKPVHASLAVLKSPDIPSILVEAGFITNRAEERLLNQRSHQIKISNAVFLGMYKHFKESPPQGTFFAQTKRAIKHTVRSGESLSVLAQRYGVSSKNLQRYNSLKSTSLRIGQVIKIPPNYQLTINDEPQRVATTSVQKERIHKVKRGESLSVIASKYDTNSKTLKQYNNLRSTSLAIGQKIKIPGGQPTSLPAPQTTQVKVREDLVHKVQRGESLSVIAAKYGTSTTNLKKYNKLRSTSLAVGQKIKVPGDSVRFVNVSPRANNIVKQERIHRVKSGESLSVIAAKYDSSTSILKSHNKLRSTTLAVGQKIKIPGDNSGTSSSTNVPKSPQKERLHRVKSGESLSVIAAKYDSSISVLKSYNKLRSTTLFVGQKIKIPSNKITSVSPVQKTKQVTKEQLHRVKSGESLSVIAAKYDSSTSVLKNYNKLRSTTLFVGQKIKIPGDHVVGISTTQKTKKVIKERVHRVKSGESLSVIADKYDSTISVLKTYNKLRSTRLVVGQKIKIPATASAKSNGVVKNTTKVVKHKVKSGESLSVIARRYGKTTQQLQRYNQLRSTSLLVGQVIKIPASDAPKATSKKVSTHKVKRGESLSIIAKRYGTTTKALKLTNKLSSSSLRIGQILKIPVT